MKKLKEYYEFIKWTFGKWTTGQKLWLVGCGFLGASIGESDADISKYLLYTGLGIWFVSYLNYVVFDIVRSEFARYKAEKAKLFTTIDEGKR